MGWAVTEEERLQAALEHPAVLEALAAMRKEWVAAVDLAAQLGHRRGAEWMRERAASVADGLYGTREDHHDFSGEYRGGWDDACDQVEQAIRDLPVEEAPRG